MDGEDRSGQGPEPDGAPPAAPDPDLWPVAQRLQELRVLLGQDQRAAAAAAGVHRATWTNWELARRKPDCARLGRWCDATGATLDWIYRGRLGALMHPDLAVELARRHPAAPGAPPAAASPLRPAG